MKIFATKAPRHKVNYPLCALVPLWLGLIFELKATIYFDSRAFTRERSVLL